MIHSDQQAIAETYHQFVVTPSSDQCGCDNTVEMAKAQIESIINNAQQIVASLHSVHTIEPWVASKITLANDYINTVAEQLRSPYV